MIAVFSLNSNYIFTLFLSDMLCQLWMLEKQMPLTIWRVYMVFPTYIQLSCSYTLGWHHGSLCIVLRWDILASCSEHVWHNKVADAKWLISFFSRNMHHNVSSILSTPTHENVDAHSRFNKTIVLPFKIMCTPKKNQCLTLLTATSSKF